VAGLWSWPLTSIQCRGQECVELYFHSPNSPPWHIDYSFVDCETMWRLNELLYFSFMAMPNESSELCTWNLVWKKIITIPTNFSSKFCTSRQLQTWWPRKTLRLCTTRLTYIKPVQIFPKNKMQKTGNMTMVMVAIIIIIIIIIIIGIFN